MKRSELAKLPKTFRILIICAMLGVSFLLFNDNSSAQNTQNFTINSFNAYYNLSRNNRGAGQLDVNEYITAQFPNFDQNHGILRALPKTYHDQDLKLKIIRVDKSNSQNAEAANWNYSTYTESGNLVLKIGDKDRYVQGTQNYHISYKMQNVINNGDSYQELYWNVNGTQWQQPINQVSATIDMPADIATNITNIACYTGQYSSTAKDCSISQKDSKVVVGANKSLAAGENLSFVIGFKPETFKIVQPTFWDKYGYLVIGFSMVAILPLFTLIFIFYKWRKYGRDPKGRGTIIAQYTPPKGCSLLINDYVLHEQARPLAISAQILNLATRGYIRIIDNSKDGMFGKKKDFALEITKEPKNELTSEELAALLMFFDASLTVGTIVNLKDLNQKLSKQTASLADKISRSATAQGFFAKDPSKVISHYRLWATLFLVVGFLSLFIFSFLAPIGISLVVSGIILMIGAKAMPAKSSKGVELHDYILGLKLYIGMAEQERIRFHDSPDNAQRQRVDVNDPRQMIKIFEDLLPYAMLFGMEKEWGKQFENIYKEQPTWYTGNWTVFNAAYLASSLHDFNGASATTFSAPASSSGSGFGGGGFSGGGGGGGGGGGW